MRVADSYQVRSLPMLVVIDKNGIIQTTNRGYGENFGVEMSRFLSDLVKE